MNFEQILMVIYSNGCLRLLPEPHPSFPLAKRVPPSDAFPSRTYTSIHECVVSAYSTTRPHG